MKTNIQESPPVTIEPMTKSEPTSNSNGTSMQDTGAITAFVTSLGKLLLREKTRDWLDMEAVARICKDKKLKLNGEIPTAPQLETALRPVFDSTGDFYAPGFVMDGYERPREWGRPFMIKWYSQAIPISTSTEKAAQ